jgi:hypothetical protein
MQIYPAKLLLAMHVLDASLDLQLAKLLNVNMDSLLNRMKCSSPAFSKKNVNMDSMDEETLHKIVCDEPEQSIKYCYHDSSIQLMN